MKGTKRRRITAIAAMFAAMCVLSTSAMAEEGAAPVSADRTTASSGAVNEEVIDAEEFAKKVIELINAARVEEGLSELKTMEDLTKAAKIRAMELEKQYSHVRPDGEKWSTIFKELNIKTTARAENIAWGYRDPAAVTKGWLESKGHRKNIMNEKYNYIAVAIHVTAAGEVTWEQLFCK